MDRILQNAVNFQQDTCGGTTGNAQMLTAATYYPKFLCLKEVSTLSAHADSKLKNTLKIQSRNLSHKRNYAKVPKSLLKHLPWCPYAV